MDLSQLSATQITRAGVIARTALPYGLDAVKAALMTAADESSFRIVANDGTTKRADVSDAARAVARQSLQFPRDAVAPQVPASKPAGTWDTVADSIGLFQQRPMFGYGSPAQLMDPVESTLIFVRGNGRVKCFLQSPAEMTLAQRCQWVQGSEFPDGIAYAPMEKVADQLIELFNLAPTWWSAWWKG